MQRIVIATILAATFAGAAFAETPNAVPEQTFVSSKSRAEVQAELTAYQKAGVNPWSTSYDPLKYFASTKSRSNVIAEYITARDEVHAFTAEDSGAEWLRMAARPVSNGRVLASK